VSLVFIGRKMVMVGRGDEAMHRFQGRRWQTVNQYSLEYHLSRPVSCVGSGIRLHKTLEFVLAGHRCSACWIALAEQDDEPIALTRSGR
jgi:hypothetical protein